METKINFSKSLTKYQILESDPIKIFCYSVIFWTADNNASAEVNLFVLSGFVPKFQKSFTSLSLSLSIFALPVSIKQHNLVNENIYDIFHNLQIQRLLSLGAF